jgi:hypothetical protein
MLGQNGIHPAPHDPRPKPIPLDPDIREHPVIKACQVLHGNVPVEPGDQPFPHFGLLGLSKALMSPRKLCDNLTLLE